MELKFQSSFLKVSTMPSNYKICVIDDEEDIRHHLVEAINEFPDFEVIGEAADYHGAVEMISKLEPDAIFLDIKILEGNAFQVIKSLKSRKVKLPAIILNTGFTDVKNIETAINDHKDCVVKLLKKPFWENWNETKYQIRDAIMYYHKTLKSNSIKYDQKLKVRTKNETWFISFEDILYIWIPEQHKGMGKVEVIAEKKSVIANKTLSQIAIELPVDFVRVSRYAIINKNYLSKIDRDDCIAILDGGHQVGIGQNYLKTLLND